MGGGRENDTGFRVCTVGKYFKSSRNAEYRGKEWRKKANYKELIYSID